jgi:hypothetical protein
MNNRCAVTEDTDRHYAKLDEDERKERYIAEKVKEVREEFYDLAESDGLDKACNYIAGAYEDEAAVNIAAVVMGDSDLEYMNTLFETKAMTLIQAEEDER